MNNNTSRSAVQNQLINTFRELWRQHILLNNTYVINNSCNFGNLASIAQSIFQNSKDFTDALLQYYDPLKSKIFELLLDNHFYITAKLVYDTMAGDIESVEIDRNVWYMNADYTAQFLSEINTYWDKAEWQKLLYNYLYMLENNLICRYTTQDEVNNYEEIENLSIIIADYMAEGIINQFNI